MLYPISYLPNPVADENFFRSALAASLRDHKYKPSHSKILSKQTLEIQLFPSTDHETLRFSGTFLFK